ncbi:DUF4384 domain-containing protein [Methyloceanibacter sp.]|uniref:DUF4384 domain-containing protein n=1 Tax=Methyloceanibacter sp. TaxID=1965321 RepID=UPI003D6CF936
MTLRRNTSIAALALLALACAMLSSSTPWAAEPALTVAAGPGESPTPGDADTAPGDTSDTAPATAPGGDKASPQASEPGKDAGAPAAEETAEPKETAPEAQPAEKAEEPAKGKEEQAAPAKPEKVEEGGEEAAPAKPDKAEEKGEEEQAAPAAPEVVPGAADASGLTVPEDPIERAAFLSFEVNCARCHQAGPLLKGSVRANFGNILELDKLADNGSLVVPGNPEDSLVYKRVLNGEMPFDCTESEADCPHVPTKKEINAIYDWVKSVGNPQCTDRGLIDEAAIVQAIANDLEKQPDHRRKGMRYITLSNLHNACVKKEDLDLYRNAVVKLLNSLSRNPDALRLRTIDPAETVIAFNLDDLNWTEAEWNRVISVYPYAMRPDTTPYETVKAVTGTPLAWVRGDWFAFTASRPPLYYDLLKLPDTFAGFEKVENVDVKKDIEAFLVKRAAFQQSGVSKHNRLIERHTISTGYFWTSYDFKGDAPAQSLFRHPLGPDGPDAFKHDGGETIFSLPNGFQGYYLNTAAGARLDKGPTEIVLDTSQRDSSVTNAISCFGCHRKGINRKADDIRNRVANDHSFSLDVKKQVEALYPTNEELKAIYDQDTKRYQSALSAAGLKVVLDTDSALESINSLSRRYEADLRQYVAAAEFGLDRQDFEAALNDVGEPFVADKNQLKQGHLPRGQFEPEFAKWITLVTRNVPVDVASLKVPGAPEPTKVADTTELTLVADRSDYKVNDKPVFTVTSKKDCNLTLIDVDASNEGVVILPNKFQQVSFLPAGKTLKFPADDAQFDYRLADPGTETVIAVCNAEGKDVDGIKHDFKSRAFTPVGNYRDLSVKHVDQTRRILVGEKQAQKAKESGEAAKPEVVAADSGLSRAAIKLEVK